MGEVNQVSNTIMTESDFNKSPLKNVMSYNRYFTNALKSQSAFTFAKFDSAKAFYEQRMAAYKKHETLSEAAIANYEELEAQYKALLGQQTSINTSLMEKYQVSNKNDLQNTMKLNNSLFDQGVYNKAANSANAAYAEYISALQTANYITHRLV